MEPPQPQKSPSLARNSSAFYLERELQGTQPSLSLLPRSCIFEHDLNRTLALDRLCQAKRCQLPGHSARDAKHRFFFIPVLRSIRLFQCKNTFKVLLAQGPLATVKPALFSLLPPSGSQIRVVCRDCLNWTTCLWFPKPVCPRTGRCGASGSTGPPARTRWVIPGRRTGCYQKSRADDGKENDHVVTVVELRFELGS